MKVSPHRVRAPCPHSPLWKVDAGKPKPPTCFCETRAAAESLRLQHKLVAAASHAHRQDQACRICDRSTVPGTEGTAELHIGETRVAQAQLSGRVTIGFGDNLGQRRATETQPAIEPG